MATCFVRHACALGFRRIRLAPFAKRISSAVVHIKKVTVRTRSKAKLLTGAHTVVFDENLLKKSKKSRDGPVTVTQTIKAEDVDYEAEQPRSTILNKLDQASLARIEDTEAHTGLGKKLDTVIKHVRLLQSDDPGCKIVRKLSHLPTVNATLC